MRVSRLTPVNKARRRQRSKLRHRLARKSNGFAAYSSIVHSTRTGVRKRLFYDRPQDGTAARSVGAAQLVKVAEDHEMSSRLTLSPVDAGLNTANETGKT
jgi:hypothetical protein